jgi:type II secretory pathway component PulM
MGLWRYSIAVAIVFAAMLDVVWWVPMHQPTSRERDAVQATIPQCRKLALQRELDKLQVEIDALSAELDAVEAQLRAGH